MKETTVLGLWVGFTDHVASHAHDQLKPPTKDNFSREMHTPGVGFTNQDYFPEGRTYLRLVTFNTATDSSALTVR